jgi:hypothetical protein
VSARLCPLCAQVDNGGFVFTPQQPSIPQGGFQFG